MVAVVAVNTDHGSCGVKQQRAVLLGHSSDRVDKFNEIGSSAAATSPVKDTVRQTERSDWRSFFFAIEELIQRDFKSASDFLEGFD